MFETGTLRELICDHFSFPKWELGAFVGGYPPSPRCSGIINLEGNCEVIYGAQ
jgi:hypothetical protein